MKIRSILVAAALAVTLPFTASAATTFAPGTYDATDYDANRATPEFVLGSRSLWTSPNAMFVTGGSATHYWTVGPTSQFVFDGTSATLSGQVFNRGEPTLAFDFLLTMSLGSSVGAYCGGGTCNGQEVDWALFTLDSGIMTGLTGTETANISYNLTQRSSHGPQAGFGANDKDATELGFSMWYDFTRTDSTVTTGPFTFASSGYGDFNMDLALDPSITGVPLPAAGWLMIAAFGGLAAAKRRKS